MEMAGRLDWNNTCTMPELPRRTPDLAPDASGGAVPDIGLGLVYVCDVLAGTWRCPPWCSSRQSGATYSRTGSTWTSAPPENQVKCPTGGIRDRWRYWIEVPLRFTRGE